MGIEGGKEKEGGGGGKAEGGKRAGLWRRSRHVCCPKGRNNGKGGLQDRS